MLGGEPILDRDDSDGKLIGESAGDGLRSLDVAGHEASPVHPQFDWRRVLWDAIGPVDPDRYPIDVFLQLDRRL